ncbi:hypothetical protein NG891_14475 [Enterococcus gallinarum]|uniref:hypothetical protein n=1 Tax=Enterococcus gallinarum TaxID=1353 RepID=UPI0020916840|nr:hypothetical protein [Enterococcus gallinarum]MCO5477951.1 hypothetical protein [Enterococcus gallinarum]
MPRNTLADLNNHLFEQLERLNDEEIQGKALQEELDRAQSISLISDKIIKNADVQLRAVKLSKEYDLNRREMPQNLFLGNTHND